MSKLILVTHGQLDVEGEHGGWLVPRGHLIFVPHRRPFNLRVGNGCELVVAHLAPDDCRWPREGCWVAPVDRVGSAMLSYALRWKDTSGDDTASLYARTLAAVCVTWFENERMLHIPSATSREIARLLAWLASDLRGASLERAAAVTGLVPRTLQRRCRDELGMTWRELLREARMMRAVELLLQGHAPSAVARGTGFASTGAFVTAFRTRMGQPPGAFLRAIDSVVLPSPRPGRATHSRGAGSRRTRTTRATRTTANRTTANRTTTNRTTGDRR